MKIYNNILFVSMPWAAPGTPMLGVGVLSSKLRGLGYETKTLNLHVEFAEVIGLDYYLFFSEDRSLNPLAEYLFASLYFNHGDRWDLNFFNIALGNDFINRNPKIIASLMELKSKVIPAYIDKVVDRIIKLPFSVIGFTSTFNQIFPSMYLAKKIKEKDPTKIILLGGSSFHGEMGIEYSAKFSDVVDYVFIGESDNSLPQFFEFLNGNKSFEEIDGIAKHGYCFKDSIPISNMQDCPEPEYDDYFEQLNHSFEAEATTIFSGLPFESSRGCWWGAKNHCTFCGLNSMGMAYRAKSNEAIIKELCTLSKKYKTLTFIAADNILPAKAYDTLLQDLADLPYQFDLFYEIKSNLRRKDVYSLYISNVNRIQPGIESFSTGILNLMKKGVTAIQNVQLLKFAKEYNINAAYNILCHFSGEKPSDYEQMLKIVRAVFHLQPPTGLAVDAEIHRFSPMHTNADEFGFKNVRPSYYYEHWFPKNFIDLNKIAYFFERDKQNDEVNLAELNELLRQWIFTDKKMYAELGANFIQIITKTQDQTKKELLGELDSIIFMLCDEIAHINSIFDKLRGFITIDELKARINCLINSNYLLNEGEKYLNIVPFNKPIKPQQISSWVENAMKLYSSENLYVS